MNGREAASACQKLLVIVLKRDDSVNHAAGAVCLTA